MTETPREKFVRLGEARVNAVISTLRLIGNLSNKSNYSYTEQDVDKIFRTLEKELKKARNRFYSGGRQEGPAFKID